MNNQNSFNSKQNKKTDGESSRKHKMTKKLIPPDGGWGWLIVVAYSVNMICTIPIIQGFGLIFRGTCADLGMTATDISVLISVNSAFGMGLGLINGPLLRYFGYRKVAIAGAMCYTIGLTLSAWANSFTFLIITWGILCSLGTSIMNSAFSLALNSYFLKKRGRAVGLAMTLNGLGPILVPQLMSFLMSHYGARGTVAILGGLSLHALVGALTLQPIAWHLKEVADIPNVEGTPKLSGIAVEDEEIGKQYVSTSCEDLETGKRKRTMTMSSIDHDVDTRSIYGFETLVPRKKSTSYVPPGSVAGKVYRRSNSQSETAQPPASPTDRQGPAYKWWSSGKSLETINLGSSMKIFEESRPGRSTKSRDNSGDGVRDDERRPSEAQFLMHGIVKEEEDDAEEDEGQNKPKKEPEEEEETKKKKKSALHRALYAIVIFFDFDLLSDPVYVNIMLGMSIAIFAEINFAILTPFILDEMNLDTEQIATVMSCLAVSDLVFRGVAPFIGEWLNQTARMMYLISLVVLTITRSGLLFAKSFTSIVFVGLSLGIGKGIRSVFMTLVISNYVPIEKLASASGIQMVTNGIIFVSVGPILGVIKDKTGSYNSCILFINATTVLAILMWTMEMIVRRSMAKPPKPIKNGAKNTGRTRNT